MLQASASVRRLAHRCGIGAAVLWWGYALFSTAFFTALTGSGLLLYLAGLLVVYLLVNVGVRAFAWLAASFRT